MKKCPFCAEEIQDEAKVCRYCGRSLDPSVADSARSAPVLSQPQWSPGVAGALSFVIPGLGQIYKSQIGKGIGFLVGAIIGYLPFIIPGLIVHLFAIIDAVTRQPQTTSPGLRIQCGDCGHVATRGPRSCPNCGHVYGTPRSSEAPPPGTMSQYASKDPDQVAAEKVANRRTGQFLIIGIGVMVLLVAIAAFIQWRRDQGTTTVPTVDRVQHLDPQATHALRCGGSESVSYKPPETTTAAALITVVPDDGATPAMIEWAAIDCLRVARESFDLAVMSVRAEAWRVSRKGDPERVPIGGADAVTFHPMRGAFVFTKGSKEILVLDAPK